MKPHNETFGGKLQIFTNGNLTATGDVVSRRRILACPVTNVRGDRKTPNSWFFTKFKETGRPWFNESVGIWYGLPARDFSISDSYITESSGLEYGDLVPGVDFSHTLDRCMDKIYDQLRGNSNLIVDLAESSATLRMLKAVRGLRKEVTRAVIGAKKHKSWRRSNGQQRLDLVTSKWLEYRYGWMPLVGSIYDAMDNLGNKVHGLIPVKARSGFNEDSNLVTGSGTYGSPRTRTVTNLSFRTRIDMTFKVPEGQKIYDWTSLNPVGIAWELMPLSFVADWFVNVSDVLSRWENYVLFANSFVGGFMTHSYRYSQSVTTKGHSYNQPIVDPVTGFVYDGWQHFTIEHGRDTEKTGMQRTVLHSLPIPVDGFRLNPKLNAKRLLDAAALFHTFTKGTVKNAVKSTR